MKRLQAWLRVLSLASLMLAAGVCRADLWGYVDPRGVAHFAAEKLDERYELFLRGSLAGNTNTPEPVAGSARPVAVPTAPQRLLAFFDVSTNYKAVRHLMRQASARYQIDYELLKAVIATESGFDPQAVSPRGAVGLMQLTPVTAQRFGFQSEPQASFNKRLAEPQTNIGLGAQYLGYLMGLFKGDVELVLAAYNSGEGSVMRAGNRVPDIMETRNFVQTVMQLYRVLKPPVTSAQAKSRALPLTRTEQQGKLPTGRANMPPSMAAKPAPAETDWY